jgi:hypothetical protein
VALRCFHDDEGRRLPSAWQAAEPVRRPSGARRPRKVPTSVYSKRDRSRDPPRLSVGAPNNFHVIPRLLASSAVLSRNSTQVNPHLCRSSHGFDSGQLHFWTLLDTLRELTRTRPAVFAEGLSDDSLSSAIARLKQHRRLRVRTQQTAHQKFRDGLGPRRVAADPIPSGRRGRDLWSAARSGGRGAHHDVRE